MKHCPYDAVLFDLDGTVSESHPGIIASVQQALRDVHWKMPADFDYRQFIGPPICMSLMQYAGMTEPQAEVCMKIYRQYYNAGEIFNTRLYRGLDHLFRTLHDSGVKVCIATSKPQPMADQVVEHLGILPQVTLIAGADSSDKSSDKSVLIRRCLTETGAAPERTVMVGDTRFDAMGANDAGVDFIGVLYGYGSRAEMEQQGAVVFAETVADLEHILCSEKET